MEAPVKRWRIKAKEGRRWIEGLRSGNYKQVYSAYDQGDWDGKPQVCALGVLNRQMERVGDASKPLKSIITCGDSTLSEVIINKNDGARMTFPQIADWIEENVVIAGE